MSFRYLKLAPCRRPRSDLVEADDVSREFVPRTLRLRLFGTRSVSSPSFRIQFLANSYRPRSHPAADQK